MFKIKPKKPDSWKNQAFYYWKSYKFINDSRRRIFPAGIPKIHEHDGKKPQAFGWFSQGRLVAFYNYESDLGDGWDDVHKDPEETRTKALQMGANIVRYVFQVQWFF